ncbi:MAG: RNA polymerase sigma factor for flagellar operon FliA [Pseudohongiellaceae bacterium]|jgi:RNA polymerase sigma factor for flagellar operon FliA
MYSEVESISQDEVVERYAPLVKRIAHHILARMPASVQVDDLIQAGLIGLLEAARNYDTSKGASFETYAGIRIRGSMIDDVRRGDWAPRSVHRNARMVAEGIQTIEHRTGRDANDQEVADELGIPIENYYKITRDSASSKLFSYDELISGDDKPGEQLSSDAINPLDGIERQALRENIAECISQLPERERIVLALYYDEELNLKEIGLVLGVSESRVSQIHSQATLRLRARMTGWQRESS